MNRANPYADHRPACRAPPNMTPPDDESAPSEPQRADARHTTARAIADGAGPQGAARASASATVHVAIPRADHAELLAALLAGRLRDHEDHLAARRRIDRQLGRLAAAMLVLAGAVLVLAVAVAASATWT